MNSYLYTIRLFYLKDKWNFLRYAITNILTVPLFLIELFLTKYVIDRIQSSSVAFSYENTLRLVIFLSIVIYVNSINSSLKAIATTRLTEIGLYQQERKILEKSNKLSLLDLDSPDTKNLRDKARKLSLFNLMDQWTNFFVSLLSIISLAIMLTYYNCIVLAIIIVTVIVVQFKVNKILTHRMEKIHYKHTSTNRLSNYIFNLLVNRETIQEVRIYKMKNFLKDKLSKIVNDNFKEVQKELILSEAIKVIENISVALLNGLSIALLVIILSKSKNGASLFILLIQVISQMFIFMPKVVTEYSSLKSSCIHFAEYIKYLDLDEIEIPKKKLKPSKNGIRVYIKGLKFRYKDNKEDTLRNINLEIKPGEKIAFVGENGSGKSTLVKIILGLYKVDKGMIRWFCDENEIFMDEVENGARIVFQDYLKLLCSIRENIALGNISELENDEALYLALEKAEANKFVSDLNDLVGPQFGGKDLSGGQWQKLAISRAYLTERLITIFDEPTASLDPNAELKAFQSFINLSDNKTSIIVTHRLYMARFVDRIFLFKDGEIVESGSHEELMNLHGEYEKIFNLQSSLYA